jgi:hypothetical protein
MTRKLQATRIPSLLLLLSLFSVAVKTSVGSEVHDVAVTYVDVGRPIIGIWRHSDIDISVQNLGNVSETFQVTAYATRISDNVSFTIDSATIQDLAPGQSDYMRFYWPQPTLTIALFPPPMGMAAERASSGKFYSVGRSRCSQRLQLFQQYLR